VFFQGGVGVVRDGLCRREPPGVFFLPVVVPVGDDFEFDGLVEESYVGWPEVFLEDWCGEFVDRGVAGSRVRHPSVQNP
jgi:hypothetical protein